MKTQLMLKSFIKTCIVLLLFTIVATAQNTDSETVNDTIVFKQKYGLRLGADISKLARTALVDDYKGFELIADYRLTKRIYLAGEIGTEETTLSNEVLNTSASGSYFKGGVDLNFYQNWLDMQNMIYTGFRIGASTFSQTLNSYSVYDVNNQYWNQQFLVNSGQEFEGLSAIWTEVQIGLKAELVNNLFAGVNVQLKFLMSETSPDNFENLYIPGYNRTYDSSSFGVGYGFNISYLVPIFKKDKIVVKEKEEN